MKRNCNIVSAMLLACVLVLTMAMSVPAWAGTDSEEASLFSEEETISEDSFQTEETDSEADAPSEGAGVEGIPQAGSEDASTQPKDEEPEIEPAVVLDNEKDETTDSDASLDEKGTNPEYSTNKKEDAEAVTDTEASADPQNPAATQDGQEEEPESESEATEDAEDPATTEDTEEEGSEDPDLPENPEDSEPEDPTPVSIKKATVTGIEDKVYSGKKQTQKVSVAVTIDGTAKTLARGTDYTISYSDNIKAGTAKISIKGIGNYTGTITRSFRIKKAPLSSVKLKYTAIKYRAVPQTQTKALTVKAAGGSGVITLKRSNFTVSYKNNTNAGTASVTVKGQGNFTGTITKKFKINPAPLYSAKLAYSALYYTGKERTQTNTIKVRAIVAGKLVTLKKGTDYIISYKNNTEVGKAVVTIIGIKNYTGKLIRTFEILPKKTTLTEVVSGTASCVVRWKKQNVQTTGYQLQISTNKSFRSGVRTLSVKKPSILQKKISNLKTGRVYYVRIRTFRTKGNNNYYSEWSPAKSVAIKANTVRITGSGISRTVTVDNPSSSYKTLKVGVWSKKGDQDDLTWYTLKKQSDGSFKARIFVLNLQHPGTCFADVYANDTKCIGNLTFSVTKSEFALTENTLKISGSGTSRLVLLIHPAASVIDPEVAVWSVEGGKDDLKWYKMTKLENGSWYANVSTIPLMHSGKVNVRCYSDDQTTLIKSGTFSSSLTTAEITWDPDWEFASYSEIHTGTPKIYRAGTNRKNIVVGINPGHGTVDGSYYYVLSHPDGSPKITGGSTAEGAVYTPADNEGMTFYDGVPEASVTLRQAEILRDILLDAGYDVIMLREGNDSGLDVVGRTVVCNELADCHIALHWDGDGLSYEKGIFYMSVPDGLKDMYPTSTIWSESDRLGECLIDGLSSQGLLIFEGGSMPIDLMQTSYSKVPSIDIELGNQVSSHTDSDLTTRAYGILDGLNEYFGE